MTKMFGNIKKYTLFKQIIRIKRFLYVFTLRQGTILVAIHQIALGSLILIVLLTGLGHVDSMMNMLLTDMEDEQETVAYYYDDFLYREDPEPINSLNNKMFDLAEYLASETVVVMYSSTMLTAIYLLSCVSLLYGAIKYKRGFMLPWVLTSLTGVALFAVAVHLGSRSSMVVDFFGGLILYYFGCGVFAMLFIYTILAVTSFVMQANQLRPTQSYVQNNGMGAKRFIKSRPRINRQPKCELGERMVLIDHAAQSSVLSTKQLHKLSNGMQSQFV